MKQRLAKAKHRRLKLHTLKIPGLAPRYRTALRQAMAQRLGHHKGGLLDSTFDYHSDKYLDPGDHIIIQHVSPSTLVEG